MNVLVIDIGGTHETLPMVAEFSTCLERLK
jgi:hypothetical protein